MATAQSNTEPQFYVLENGLMSILLKNDVRVEISLDFSIRILDSKNRISIAMNPSGTVTGLIHPMGRVQQSEDVVDVVLHGKKSLNYRSAKLGNDGISFTAHNSPTTYVVGPGGVKTKVEYFDDLANDFTLDILYKDCRYGPAYLKQAAKLLKKGIIQQYENGHYYTLKDTIVTQSGGVVIVDREIGGKKHRLLLSSVSGAVRLVTPTIHCTASKTEKKHLFIRTSPVANRMHFDGASFSARHEGQAAGFDRKDQLKIFGN